ncbi:hypothetical protein X975_07297, partial [Stegodyphus mimosarum]
MGRKSRLKAIKRSSKKEKPKVSKESATKKAETLTPPEETPPAEMINYNMRDASTQTPEETQLVLVPTGDPQALIWDIQQMTRPTTEETILSDIPENKNNVPEARVLDKPVTKRA